jgi:hypothetical protein
MIALLLFIERVPASPHVSEAESPTPLTINVDRCKNRLVCFFRVSRPSREAGLVVLAVLAAREVVREGVERALSRRRRWVVSAFGFLL